MKRLSACCALLLALAGGSTWAQRTLVPVVDYVDVPISIYTSATLSTEQVRQAMLQAAPSAEWTVTPQPDGQLEATFNKGDKHRIVVLIAFDAQKLSLSYKSSIEMRYRDQPYPTAQRSLRFGIESESEQAEKKQQARLSRRLEWPYAKPHGEAVIHPFYDDWVGRLLNAVHARLGAQP